MATLNRIRVPLVEVGVVRPFKAQQVRRRAAALLDAHLALDGKPVERP
jgi:hypothetical protein